MNLPEQMTEEMRQAFFDAQRKYPWYRDAERRAGRGWKTLPDYIYEAVVSAAPTPPAAEPVGFRYKNKDEGDDWSWAPIRFLERNKSDDRVFELLYTHPAPPDELVKAAEDVLEILLHVWVDTPGVILNMKEKGKVNALRIALDKTK